METMTTRQVGELLGLTRQGVHLAAKAVGVKPASKGNHKGASLWRVGDMPRLMARRTCRTGGKGKP